MTSPQDEPPVTIGKSRILPIPQEVVLEWNAAYATDLLNEAHQACEHAACCAERYVGQQPTDASAADIVAEWRASNFVRREMMRLAKERGDNLISAINAMLALE